MRVRIALFAAAWSFASTFASASASATDCAGVVSPCIDDDALWPHAGYARFEAVGSVDTIAPGQLGFALVTTYLSRPVVLQLAPTGAASGRYYAVNEQGDGTFLWSYGVSRKLELDLALPLTLGQGGTGLSPVTGGAGLSDTAARDVRFGFAYALLPGHDAAHSDGSGLAMRFEVSAPTGDLSQFAGERSGVFVPSLAGELRFGRLVGGAEIGARLRPPAELLGARVGTQLAASIGLGWDLLAADLLTAQIEAWALPTLVSQDRVRIEGAAFVNEPGGGALVPSEWQLSLRTALARKSPVSLQFGGGGALPLSGDVPVTSPRFRLLLGVRWAPLAPPP